MSALPEQVHSRTTAVAPRDANQQIDSSDVLLPRMKIAQYMSRVVTDELVPYGAVYVALGRDDMEPVVIAEPAKGKGDLGQAVRFYVLDVRKGYSFTDPQGELQISQDGSHPSLSLVKNQDPSNVRRTYDYTICLPAYTDLPVRFLMHGSWGGQAAKSLNTRLMLAKSKGIEPHTVPFKLQAKKTENNKGSFAQAIVAPDEVTAKDRKKDLELVDQFIALVGNPDVDDVAPASEPAPAAPSLD